MLAFARNLAATVVIHACSVLAGRLNKASIDASRAGMISARLTQACLCVCLFVCRYVDALHRTKMLGVQHKLDIHLLPQTATNYNFSQNSRTWMGTIGSLPDAMNGRSGLKGFTEGLASYGLQPFIVGVTHTTPKKDWMPSRAGLAQLCPYALPEYHELQLHTSHSRCDTSTVAA
jgi:hypothetical protein